MTGVNGFTLLELVIVLSLIAILAGVGVLSHQAIRPSLDLSVAARQVAMDLKVARMRAVAENVNHRLLFTDGSASYQYQRKSGDGYADEGMPVRLPKGIVIAACSASDDAISFRPRGNAGSFGTVTIQNGKGEVRRIVVDIAGQVRVQ